MSSYNRVVLVGNLGREPETRTAGSSSVTSFSLAVNEKWKTRDGDTRERTDWVDVEAWGKTGDLVAQYLSKGSQCLVEGRLRQDTWEDRDTGKKRSRLKVNADRVVFLGGRHREEDPRLAAQRGEPSNEGYGNDVDDDIPF